MASHMNWDESRKDWLGSLYAEIAVENYYYAKCQLEHAQKENYQHFFEIRDAYDSIVKHAISSIVFSAMSLEALINDYTASMIGDAEFFDNFEKLSTIGKLSLISRFIFHKSLDKDKPYYSGMKKLFKQRNTYVHSKTKETTSDEQEIEFLYHFYNDNYPYTGKQMFEESLQNESASMVDDARDAIKAMYNVAQYIDENDSDTMATMRLLNPQIIAGDNRFIMQAKQNVYPEIGITLHHNELYN